MKTPFQLPGEKRIINSGCLLVSNKAISACHADEAHSGTEKQNDKEWFQHSNLIYYLDFQLSACLFHRDKADYPLLSFCSPHRATWIIYLTSHLCHLVIAWFHLSGLLHIALFPNLLHFTCPWVGIWRNQETGPPSGVLSGTAETRELISSLFVNHSLKYLLSAYSCIS